MGTRADFYVGRGTDAVWLGSVAWDGNPGGVDEAVFKASDEAEYRSAVSTYLANEDGVLPERGWPCLRDDRVRRPVMTDPTAAFLARHPSAAQALARYLHPTPADVEAGVLVEAELAGES